MARRQTLGRQLDAIRKKAQTYVKGLKRQQAKKSGAAAESIGEQISHIEGLISKSYMKSRTAADKQKAAQAGESLRAYSVSGQRKTKLFASKLASADKIGLGGDNAAVSGAIVNAFYMSTQQLWRGVPLENRNNAIMERLGVSSLKEAFEQFKSENADFIDKVRETFREHFGDIDTSSEAFQAMLAADPNWMGDSDKLLSLISEVIQGTNQLM